MFRLGIDIGASSCRFILMNGKNEISLRKSFLHHNKVKRLVADSLEEIHRIAGDESVLLSVCGTMSHLLGLPPEYTSSETIAMTQAIGRYYPSVSSCIMIGAQNTLYIEMAEGRDAKIRRNSNCSAGTGSFFEEQAGRLGIKIEEISDLIKIHHTVIGLTGDGVIYTALDRLFDADRGKLDFCVGDMARYRLAKLFCAESPFFSGVLMVQSNEEKIQRHTARQKRNIYLDH